MRNYSFLPLYLHVVLSTNTNKWFLIIIKFKEPHNPLNLQSFIFIGWKEHMYNTTRGMNDFSWSWELH